MYDTCRVVLYQIDLSRQAIVIIILEYFSHKMMLVSKCVAI